MVKKKYVIEFYSKENDLNLYFKISSLQSMEN